MKDEDREWLEELKFGNPSIDRVATAFRRRIARCRSIGVRPDHLLTRWESNVLTMAVDIGDAQRHCVVRTLSADCDGLACSSASMPRGSWLHRSLMDTTVYEASMWKAGRRKQSVS